MRERIIFLFVCLIFLNGCPPGAALVSFVGPAITTVATGNIYQAGLTYSFNQTIERNTGKTTLEHISEILEPKEKKIEIEEDFFALVGAQINKTRYKLFSKTN